VRFRVFWGKTREFEGDDHRLGKRRLNAKTIETAHLKKKEGMKRKSKGCQKKKPSQPPPPLLRDKNH